MMRGLILIVAIVVGVVAWWQVIASPTAEDIRTSIATYQLSTIPDDPVVIMKSWGGMAAGHQVTHILFGDGRLHYDSSHKEGLRTSRLSYLEMTDLVDVAVKGGLVGLDWETLEAEILKKHSAVATMTDTPWLSIEFFLASAQNAEGEEIGPITSKFSCVCIPPYMAIYNADVPEVQSLDAFTKAFDVLMREKGE